MAKIKHTKSNDSDCPRYSIDDVFNHIEASPINGQRVSFYYDKIHLRSTRLLNFKVHGIMCVECGIKGAFFLKERNGKDCFLNLYTFGKDGEPLLMTRDHIKPRSKGGTNHLYNLQPMCLECNSKKADKWGIKDRIRYLIRNIKRLFNKVYR